MARLASLERARTRLAKLTQFGSGCWTFTGQLDREGYGRFTFAPWRCQRAHRFAWQSIHGEIPPTVLVLHTCDNPACVRSDHLFLGDTLSNVMDKVAKGRQSRGEKHRAALMPSRKRGERHHAAKLDRITVLALRLEHEEDGTPWAVMARRVGVHAATVRSAVIGETWG